jgi:hypothetical protein
MGDELRGTGSESSQEQLELVYGIAVISLLQPRQS